MDIHKLPMSIHRYMFPRASESTSSGFGDPTTRGHEYKLSADVLVSCLIFYNRIALLLTLNQTFVTLPVFALETVPARKRTWQLLIRRAATLSPQLPVAPKLVVAR